MKWWLLQHCAAWCGLKVGLMAQQPGESVPRLVVLSRSDAETKEAIRVLTDFYDYAPFEGGRAVGEWTCR